MTNSQFIQEIVNYNINLPIQQLHKKMLKEYGISVPNSEILAAMRLCENYPDKVILNPAGIANGNHLLIAALKGVKNGSLNGQSTFCEELYKRVSEEEKKETGKPENA